MKTKKQNKGEKMIKKQSREIMVIEKIKKFVEFTKQTEGEFRRNIKDRYGEAIVGETLQKVILFLDSLLERKRMEGSLTRNGDEV